MTNPTVDDTLQSLDVELAKFGGIDIKSSTQLTAYVGMIATLLGTTHVGQWAGVPANARIISAIGFALICVIHIVMRYIHHGVVEQHNTTLKTKLIEAAQAAATPVVVDSPPSAEGVIDPTPEDPAAVDDTTSVDIGADLPVNDATSAPDPAP